PGVCVATSRKGRDADFTIVQELAGGTDTDKGSTTGEVIITVTIKASQRELWQRVAPQIDSNRLEAVSATLGIRHPEPNSRGIRDVRVLDISGGAPTGKGGKTFTIKCREWFPAPKATKTKYKAPTIESMLNNQPTRYTS